MFRRRGALTGSAPAASGARYSCASHVAQGVVAVCRREGYAGTEAVGLVTGALRGLGELLDSATGFDQLIGCDRVEHGRENDRAGNRD